MADFFQRLSEQTIYHRTGVQPLLAPHFAAPAAFSQPLFELERAQQVTAEFGDAPHELAAAAPRLVPLVAHAANVAVAFTPALQLRQLAGSRSQPLPPPALPAPTAQAARLSAESVAMTTVVADAPQPDNHRVGATDSLPASARPVDEVVTPAPVQITTLRAPTAAADQPPATNVPAEAAAVAAAGPNPPAIGATHQQQMIGQTTRATALQPNRSTAHRTVPISPLVPTPAAERAPLTVAESTLERALVTPAAAGPNNDQLSPALMRPVPAPAVVGERTVATAPLVPSTTDASPAVAVGSAVNQPGAAALQPLVPMAPANVPLVQRTPLVAPGTTPVKQAGTAPTAPSTRRTMVQGQMGGEAGMASRAVGPTHQPSGIAGDPSALGHGGEQRTASGAVGPTHQPSGFAGDPSALGRGGEAGMASRAVGPTHQPSGIAGDPSALGRGGEQTMASEAVGPTKKPSGFAGDPSALGRGGEAGMAPLAQSQQHDAVLAYSGQPVRQVRRATAAANYLPPALAIAEQLTWPAQPTQPAQQDDNFALTPFPSQPGVVPPWRQRGVVLPWRQPSTAAEEQPSLGPTKPAQAAPTSASPTMAPVRPNETTARLPTLVAAERKPAAVRTAPTIRVTIGRIEVRTASEPPAAPRRATRTALSLDEYLQKTQRRSR